MNTNNRSTSSQPLAASMRPQHVAQFVGQQHLLAPGKPLATAIAANTCHSMILWGPPGTGKTTLANLLAQSANAHIEKLSAVLAGVKEIRQVIQTAKELAQTHQRKTVLFIDEIHRFNKAQQDAFLPFVEDGTITLIGATTENPSFELNSALLSRVRVYVLNRLTEDDLLTIIDKALADPASGLDHLTIHFSEQLRLQLATAADGDARRCLNLLDVICSLAEAQGKASPESDAIEITEELLTDALHKDVRRFSKNGDDFYNQISALHKAIRGSSPDAALYWFCRMIDGGCDPHYIARRLVRMASEDIGNADPRALALTLQAWDTFQRLGSPEGELALAQAIIYLASCAKSNACYTAYHAAMADVKKYGSLEVPLHIRNAPTKLMKNLDYGKNYRYAHDEPDAYAAGECYFPEGMPQQQYYFPVDRGLEKKIRDKLSYLRSLEN